MMNSDDANDREFRLLRSLSRLMMGALLVGTEAVKERLQTWDDSGEPNDSVEVETEPETEPQFDPLPAQLPAPQLIAPPPAEPLEARYALIGLLFESEEKLERALTLTKRVVNLAGRAAAPLIQPVTKIPNPAQPQIDRLAQRGQSEVDRWVNRGRAEAERSRQMAQDAVITTVDESLDYLARNPSLEQLVQQQSVSFASQILMQVRELAVSADYFFEGLVRYLLRRRPRYLLPPPSPEVQAQAIWRLRDLRNEDL